MVIVIVIQTIFSEAQAQGGPSGSEAGTGMSSGSEYLADILRGHTRQPRDQGNLPPDNPVFILISNTLKLKLAFKQVQVNPKQANINHQKSHLVHASCYQCLFSIVEKN